MIRICGRSSSGNINNLGAAMILTHQGIWTSCPGIFPLTSGTLRNTMLCEHGSVSEFIFDIVLSVHDSPFFLCVFRKFCVLQMTQVHKVREVGGFSLCLRPLDICSLGFTFFSSQAGTLFNLLRFFVHCSSGLCYFQGFWHRCRLMNIRPYWNFPIFPFWEM